MLLYEFVLHQAKIKDYVQNCEGGLLWGSKEKHFIISALLLTSTLPKAKTSIPGGWDPISARITQLA